MSLLPAVSGPAAFMQLPESVQPGLVTRITRLLGDHDTGEGETSDPAQKLGVSQPSERPRGADPKIWNLRFRALALWNSSMPAAGV